MEIIIFNSFRINKVFNFKVNSIIKRTMLGSVRKGADSMHLARETFLKFCSHFKQTPITEVLQDQQIIKYFKNTLDHEKYLCNKAFQLALDVAYSRRIFDRSILLKIFNQEFSVRNVLDPSDNCSGLDQSTLFSIVQSKIVKNIYSSWEITVIQTPHTKDIPSLSSLSPTLQNTLEENKTLTGNRFPDVSINEVPYDYKFTTHICNTKNQIYIMPESIQAVKDFSSYLNHLYKYIGQTELPPTFKALMKNKLEIMQNELQRSPSLNTMREISESWNKFLIQTSEQRPPGFGAALFIITNKPYILDSSLLEEKVVVPEGHLNQLKAKVAIKSIIENYPVDLQDNIYKATKGSLGHVLQHTDTNNPD